MAEFLHSRYGIEVPERMHNSLKIRESPNTLTISYTIPKLTTFPFVLGVGFLILAISISSIDNFLSGEKHDNPLFYDTGIWFFVIIGIPLLIFFILWIYSMSKQINEKPASLKKMIIGMMVMLSGALGFDSLANFAEENWRICILFEEGFEMIGVTIILWSAYELTSDFFTDMVVKNHD